MHAGGEGAGIAFGCRVTSLGNIARHLSGIVKETNVGTRSLVATAIAVAVVVAFSAASRAQTMRFQDWAVSYGPGHQEASTGSNTGELLGVFCALEVATCFAYFTTGSNCIEDRQVPVFINSDSGAISLGTQCKSIPMGSGRIWVNVFQDFSTIAGIMLRDRRIGIVVPLENGLFKAVRFSLLGSNEAIAAAERLPVDRSGHAGDQVF